MVRWELRTQIVELTSHLPGKSGAEEGKRFSTSCWTFQQRVLASLEGGHNLGHHCNLQSQNFDTNM